MVHSATFSITHCLPLLCKIIKELIIKNVYYTIVLRLRSIRPMELPHVDIILTHPICNQMKVGSCVVISHGMHETVGGKMFYFPSWKMIYSGSLTQFYIFMRSKTKFYRSKKDMMDKVLHLQRQMNNVLVFYCHLVCKYDKVLLESGYVGHSSTDFEHGVKCST